MEYVIIIFVVTCFVFVWVTLSTMVLDMWHGLDEEEDDGDSFV